MQALKQAVDERFTFDVSEEWEEEDDGGKSEPPAISWPALEGICAVRKYLMQFEVNDNRMAAFSGTENELYRVQQKAKNGQFTLMDMWKK